MASRLRDPQTPKLSQKNRILDNGSYHDFSVRAIQKMLRTPKTRHGVNVFRPNDA